MAKSRVGKASAALHTRLSLCRQAMRRAKFGAYLITNRVDQIYLTGFDGEDGAAVITLKDVHLITDSRFSETLKMKAPWAKAYLRRNGLIHELSAVLKRARIRRLAFQDDHVTVQWLNAVKKGCKGVRFEVAGPIVNRLRTIKDRPEIQHIRESIRMAEQAFMAMRKQIRIGMTETQVAALLEYEMRQRGSMGPSFPTIVAEGRNAALPHAEPGQRVLKRGSLLLVDWGATAGHYCSDLTRVLFIGKILPHFKTVYQIVLQAQQRAIQSIAPGRRMCDIDRVARDHIAQAGYGDKFGHGLGHGIGLDIHENPRVRIKVTDELEAGMVVTIEPGIYLPGVGGVRIEDDVLVTAQGHEVLTKIGRRLSTAVV